MTLEIRHNMSIGRSKTLFHVFIATNFPFLSTVCSEWVVMLLNVRDIVKRVCAKSLAGDG